MSQVTRFGAQIKHGSEVTSLSKLGVPGKEKLRLTGAGVSYCGTCDAPFFKSKKVVSIGGGNIAVEDTLHLAKFASKVTLVHRRQEFRATRVLTEELMSKVNEPGSNLQLKLDAVVTTINGEGKVESVTIKVTVHRIFISLSRVGLLFAFVEVWPIRTLSLNLC